MMDNRELTAVEYLEARMVVDKRMTISVKQAAELMGIGHTKMWELIMAGEVKSYVDGRWRRVITESVWRRMITLARVSEKGGVGSFNGG